MGGELLHLRPHLPRRGDYRAHVDAGEGVGARARSARPGVVEAVKDRGDLDVVRGDPQLVRDDLRRRGLVALPPVRRPDLDRDLPQRVHPHRSAREPLAWDVRSAPDHLLPPWVRTAWVHVAPYPDPHIPAPLLEPLLLRSPPFVTHNLQGL